MARMEYCVQPSLSHRGVSPGENKDTSWTGDKLDILRSAMPLVPAMPLVHAMPLVAANGLQPLQHARAGRASVRVLVEALLHEPLEASGQAANPSKPLAQLLGCLLQAENLNIRVMFTNR
jgi:hypothetical protein